MEWQNGQDSSAELPEKNNNSITKIKMEFVPRTCITSQPILPCKEKSRNHSKRRDLDQSSDVPNNNNRSSNNLLMIAATPAVYPSTNFIKTEITDEVFYPETDDTKFNKKRLHSSGGGAPEPLFLQYDRRPFSMPTASLQNSFLSVQIENNCISRNQTMLPHMNAKFVNILPAHPSVLQGYDTTIVHTRDLDKATTKLNNRRRKNGPVSKNNSDEKRKKSV